MPQKVIILGAGVAGLSAAHELNERGFDVHVYERQPSAGGKARSEWVPGSGTDGRHDLPGEHGFRFFARFYRHLPDTMRRIPYGNNPNGVLGNLVEGQRTLIAQPGQKPIEMPTGFPRSFEEMRDAIINSIAYAARLKDEDLAFLLQRLWQVATSCEERKLAEYEKMTWWDFIGAEQRDQVYQEFASIIRITVAADPHTADARTNGNMALQMFFGVGRPGISNDRLLNGPTNLAWIDPWVEYLRQRGVRFHFNTPLQALHCEQGQIQHVIVSERGTPTPVTGDYYLVCVPVEAIAALLRQDIEQTADGQPRYRNVLQADPSLAGILPLSENVAWMNGIQFFLRHDAPIVQGHAMYLGTPWALTSVSQHQFWSHLNLSDYGDGTVQGILSVDISDWNTPGILYGKKARDCTIEEIAKESWAQLKACLNVDGQEILQDADLHSYHVDADISRQEVPTAVDSNAEPLLINCVDTWHLRPAAYTAIPNLFLASDYVRTNTELATMEAANEAARRAVNAIIAASGSSASLCQIWELPAPVALLPWRWYDRWRFQRGLPWKARIPRLVVLGYTLVQVVVDIWRFLHSSVEQAKERVGL